jgi:hypothetical protein
MIEFMAKNRNYSFKDVDMLTASKIIAGNFKKKGGHSPRQKNA